MEFWKNVLWSDVSKLELLDPWISGMFGAKRYIGECLKDIMDSLKFLIL